MIVVSDTSPLRALQALDLLSILPQLFGPVLVPPAVARELGVEIATLGALDLSAHPFLNIREPRDLEMVRVLKADIGEGEAEAIALAIETRAQAIIIDESAGRRIARRHDLKTIGAMRLLVLAKQQGLVDRVGPLIDLLESRIHFRISSQLREEILRDAGE